MKKILVNTFKFLYFYNCFMALFTMPIHAYIDPSVVTYVIQGVAGVLIALGAAFTIFRHKIVQLLKGTKKAEDTSEERIELKEVDE